MAHFHSGPTSRLRSAVIGHIAGLAQQRPRIYLGLVTVAAVAGFAYLALFPALIVAGLDKMGEALAWEGTRGGTALAWMSVALLAAVVTTRIFTLRPHPPAGIPLDRTSHGALYDLLDGIRATGQGPAIQRVVITGGFELNVVRTPACGLPLGYRNTLVLGLPLLLSLSPSLFRCALFRRLRQGAPRRLSLLRWLNELRGLWDIYRQSYARQLDWGYEPLHWFFRVYAPLYNIVSVHAARMDELEADLLARTRASDDELLHTITAIEVHQLYLQHVYWPHVQRGAASDTTTTPRPFERLHGTLRAWHEKTQHRRWIAEALRLGRPWNDPLPPFKDRIQGIGHLTGAMPDTAGTAAHTCLGDDYTRIVQALDHTWRSTVLPTLRSTGKRRDDTVFGQLLRHIRSLAEATARGAHRGH